MNGRRAWAILLAIALALGGVGAWAEETAAQAAPAIAEGNGWTLAADGRMTVTSQARLNYDNRSDVEWYACMDQILSLEVEEGVTSVGTYAFCDAVNLRRVHLPESLRSIGMSAFSGCVKLQALELPQSLTRIDYWAFTSCDALEQVVIGSEGMRQLDNYAFQYCRGLLRVVISAPVERLGYDVLEGCASMKALYLPESVTLIDQYALRGCDALTDIYYAGSEAQWQAVQVKRGNDEALTRATVHFESAWDPQTAGDVSALRPEYPDDMWIRLWGILEMNYASEDYYGFVRGNLDGMEATLAEADVDRATVESYLEGEYTECLLIPRGESYWNVNCYCIGQACGTDLGDEATLAQMRREQPDALDEMLRTLTEGTGLGEPVDFVQYGGMEFAQYLQEDRHVYFTIQNGCVFALSFVTFEGGEAQAWDMEADIMQAVNLCVDSPEEAPEEPGDGADGEYVFMDGKLTLRFDPTAYDVYLQDNSGNVEMLEKQGLSVENMDQYMNMLGYQLMAIPAGTPFRDAKWRFLLHAKAPAYPSLKNLKDLSEIEKRVLCNAIMSGFGDSNWELVKSDTVDYIAFEALNSVRYATVVDERMVYLYVASEDGPVTDEHREALRSIMEGVRWNLD